MYFELWPTAFELLSNANTRTVVKDPLGSLVATSRLFDCHHLSEGQLPDQREPVEPFPMANEQILFIGDVLMDGIMTAQSANCSAAVATYGERIRATTNAEILYNAQFVTYTEFPGLCI